MRGVLLEVPDSLIAERKRLGLDRYDEMWEGVLHMAPAPKNPQQRLVAVLLHALFDGAEAAGLEARDGINVCHPERTTRDYRVPDAVVVEKIVDYVVGDEFGVSGGIHLAVEVRSPYDEAYDKVDFYAARGVRVLAIIDPAARLVTRYDLQADGTYRSTSGAGPIAIGFAVSVAVGEDGAVTVACPAGSWRT
jgi:Uma2 family endonuclease